jgi:hypothetical protein
MLTSRPPKPLNVLFTHARTEDPKIDAGWREIPTLCLDLCVSQLRCTVLFSTQKVKQPLYRHVVAQRVPES